MGTAQASGIAMVVAARRGLPVALHTPSEVKAAVTGSGRADKAQVGAMVTRLLRLDAPPKPADAADALALAICHIWRGGAQARIDAAAGRGAPDRHRRQSDDRLRPGPGRRRRPRLSAVLEVGGVGLELHVHARAPWPRCAPAAPATLPTSMVVREDSLTLFGFPDDDEKSVFELLQTASGVGPKLAQAMLAVLTPDELRARGRRRGRQDAHHGARASARRAPSGSSSSSRTGSAPRSAPAVPRPRAVRRRRPGASQVHAGPRRARLVGQGGRPARSRPSPRRRGRSAAPDVGRRCSGPPCAR